MNLRLCSAVLRKLANVFQAVVVHDSLHPLLTTVKTVEIGRVHSEETTLSQTDRIIQRQGNQTSSSGGYDVIAELFPV